jgi:PAS domain S-box-containing protein
MAAPQDSPQTPWYLILTFALLSLGILVTGLFYYRQQKAFFKQQKSEELISVVDLKIRQIVDWRNERIGDANIIMEDSFFAERVEDWLSGQAPHLREEIRQRLKIIQDTYHYESLALMDLQGKAQLNLPESPEQPGPNSQKLAQEAMGQKKPAFSDLFFCKVANCVRLNLALPLLLPRGEVKVPVAVILMRIDPQKLLYPLVQSWPTPSPSAETVLARQEGDDVVFLNELRHRRGAPLTLRLPVATPQLPIAMAVRGQTGVVEGVDYRGVPVVAVVAKIPDTPWYLTAKVDAAEIYGPLRERLQVLAFLVLALISVSGVLVILFWRNQQALFYRRQYQGERERRSLAQRYEYLTRQANDIILLADQDLKIVEANDQAVRSYGWTPAELAQMHLMDLHPPQDRAFLAAQMEKGQQQCGFLFEASHLRRDGSSFPVEVSSSPVEVQGEKFCQLIIRDITERKKAEAAIRESEGKLHYLASQLMTVQEQERRRLALELHDELGQSLMVLKMLTRSLEKRLPDQDPELKSGCQEILQFINEIIENIRRLSRDLSPSILEDLGLTAALKHLLARFEEHSEIKLSWDLDEMDGLFSPEARISIYRIFQESLTNISKYASPSKVEVSAKRDGEAVVFKVEDDGVGFDVEEALTKTHQRGLGLLSMSERVRALGGSFYIWSQKGAGTKISFTIPGTSIPSR